MAVFTKVNGTTQPVFALDVANGSIAGTANVAAQGPVQIQGPKLDFFKLLINDGSAVDLQAEVGTGLGVEAILENIQTKSTVAIYQVEDDTSGQISIATYPTGAYTAATLQTQIRLLTAAGSTPVDCSSSTVADAGMKLA